MPSQSDQSIAEFIREFIFDPEVTSFDEKALRLFEFQFKNNRPYRNYCLQLKHSPENTPTWTQIPPVPTNAFKYPEFPLTCGEEITKTFLTSGTTTEIRGAHHFPDTTLYEHALTRGWQNASFPDLPPFFLAPSAEESPHSSLSHMFHHLNTGGPDTFLLRNSKFNLLPLLRHLDTGHPLFLMGTALAFLHLMETHTPLPLPPGSQLLETGGYKGTTHSLAKPDFYQQLATFFDLPPDHIHNEYGMTELSSQAYATGPDGNHRFPPWCRHLILDPESAREVPVGEPGYLQLHDLANVHSVAAIRTQDFAIGHSDGSFTLIGRDPGALPRGCSRTIDHALTS
ncbi:hypothetical protein V2O64_11635 [Verrucomicrobiaceae bacterium 227]